MRNMVKQWWWAINSSGLGIYLVGLALLGGMSLVADQIRGDHQPAPSLSRYDQPLQPRDSDLFQEGDIASAEPTSSGAPWTAHVRRVDEALAQKDVRTAEQAWLEGYRTALSTRRWEGFVEVGDAYLRIGQVMGPHKAPETKARRLYLAALFRAREQRSLDGVLRSAEAFAGLGDREMAAQGLRIAHGLATRERDPQIHARVRALADRVAAAVLEARSPASDPF